LESREKGEKMAQKKRRIREYSINEKIIRLRLDEWRRRKQTVAGFIRRAGEAGRKEEVGGGGNEKKLNSRRRKKKKH